ncbi:MAG: hypothetical protein AAFS07_10145 [Pseudomonadota bacterium]
MSGHAITGQAAGPLTGSLTGEATVEALVADGLSLLSRERAFCRSGQLENALALAEEKTALVDRLATALPGVRDVAAARAALTRLARAARDNERLLAAAREGVRAARRRLSRLGAAQRGAVAYDAAGGTILSWEDAAGKSRRA